MEIIVGDKPGSFGSYRFGYEIYNKAASKNKELTVLPGISHYDLYDQPKAVEPAVAKLTTFFNEIYNDIKSLNLSDFLCSK
ncbi:Uncharacterized conserved protein [Weissella viridescens]|uniref:Uncharacterized conserved protein n=1 Tax=Weissella viridescens TaxID=1629 RepID=A0A380P6N3_WEIVI|nr:Uncharacterized conserved protein [Weissella viridescens]